MNKDRVLPTLQKRLRQFKRYGYDLPASRRKLLELSEILDGKILEVGTGKGHLTALLVKKNLNPVSIDLDPKSLRIAKLHLKELGLGNRATLRKMNAEKLSYAPRSFDHVISIDFFHHAQKPLRCLQELIRVSKKTLAIADLNKRGMRVMDLVHKNEGNKHEGAKIPFRELKKRLLSSGFNIKSYHQPCHDIFVAQRRNS